MIFCDEEMTFARRVETANRRSESNLPLVFGKNPLITKSLHKTYVMYLSASARTEETSTLMLTADIDFSKLHIFFVWQFLCKYRRYILQLIHFLVLLSQCFCALPP